MGLWDSLVSNASNTKLVKNAQNVLQNIGYQQQQSGIQTGHKGSWGTVDYGLTELAQQNWMPGKVGADTGGSNLLGGYTPQPSTSSGPNMSYERMSVAPTNNSSSSGSNTKTTFSGYNPADQNKTWFYNEFGQPTQNKESGPSQEDMIRNEIGSGWDTYIAGLDQALGSLGTQKGAMEGKLGSQLRQAENTLGAQKEEGASALGQERVKTEGAQKKNFQQLSEDLRNQMQAGNIYLGARGAGDSSAANMYSYALGRQGNQVRGDLMSQTADIQNQINVREENLNRIYNTEINNTKEEYNQGMQEVARWFAESQSQIEQAKATAGRDKSLSLAQLSYDILNQAKTRVQELQDMAYQKQAALESWAMNNSQSVNEAKQNLASVSNYYAPALQMGQITGATGGVRPQTFGGQVATGYGRSDEEKKNLTNIFG